MVCNTIRGLVNLGHEVSLVSLNAKKHIHESDERDELLDKINYRVYDIDASVSLWDGLTDVFSKSTYNIDRYFDEEFEKLLIRTVKNIHCHCQLAVEHFIEFVHQHNADILVPYPLNDHLFQRV